jgi:ribosomal protein S25
MISQGETRENIRRVTRFDNNTYQRLRKEVVCKKPFICPRSKRIFKIHKTESRIIEQR